jgi:hypothetical protein
MRKCQKRRGVFLGVALALAVLAPASASASTGAIEGIAVEPSLAHASVQNLSVAYDGCSVAGNPTCTWNAHAWLVGSPDTSCPPDGSRFLLYLEHPPGLPPPPPGVDPGLGAREVWRSADSTGDGTVQSGPLQLNLEGVDDQYLCLYATRQPVITSTYTPELPDPSDLLASQLLHVDLPPSEGDQPAAPTAPAACRKYQVRRHNRCVNKRARHRGHRHRAHR